MNLERTREGYAAFVPRENKETNLNQAERLRKSSSVF
jgi:hypothetical protein